MYAKNSKLFYFVLLAALNREEKKTFGDSNCNRTGKGCRGKQQKEQQEERESSYFVRAMRPKIKSSSLCLAH
jgi:hypothetical protein